jgi:hypothetical protein
MPARANGMDAGTASQLIPGVRPTCGGESTREPTRAWTRRIAGVVRTERLRRPTSAFHSAPCFSRCCAIGLSHVCSWFFLPRGGLYPLA